jgi:hypothetical protein
MAMRRLDHPEANEWLVGESMGHNKSQFLLAISISSTHVVFQMQESKKRRMKIIVDEGVLARPGMKRYIQNATSMLPGPGR